MKYIYILIVAIVASACTKEIELDYPQEKQKLVIDASLNWTYQQAEVRIFNSMKLNQQYWDPITTAKVSIEDIETGKVNELVFNFDKAAYTNPNAYFEELWDTCKTYKLNVLLDGKRYNSTCNIENPVWIDSTILRRYITPSANKTHMLFVHFTDPQNEKNYYQVHWFTNPQKTHTSIIDDAMFNGTSFAYPLQISAKIGDNINVELRSITKEVYLYLKELYSGNNLMGGSPSTPPSNISGDVLGYFSAYSSDLRSVYVNY